MEEQSYIEFLQVLHQAMFVLFGLSLLVALIIFVSYKVKYASQKEKKDKYDLASTSEIKSYLRVNYAIAAGIFFFCNTLYEETIQIHPLWIFIRFFISFCLATLHVYVAYLVFKYYYPSPLSKKLKKLRYSPRINPSTGNQMKLLGEDEEDAYLDEGMQAEEDVFSVDYDVWIDPQTEETKIEKYKGHLSALECDRCGFQTLRLQKEEVKRDPEGNRDGEIQKEYKCSYCGRIKRKTVKLTADIEKSAAMAKIAADHTSSDSDIQNIKIEIHGNSGEVKSFDFQNRTQAETFLREFNFAKLKQEEESWGKYEES